MNRTLLQIVGLLALLALAAVGVGGLLLVKDRVTLVVRSDGAHDEDPTRQATLLLRDEVQSLRTGFEQLGRALNEQLPELARRLDDAERARSEELARSLQAARADAAAQGERLASALAAAEQRAMARLAAVTERVAQPTSPAEAPAAPPTAPPTEPPVIVANAEATPAAQSRSGTDVATSNPTAAPTTAPTTAPTATSPSPGSTNKTFLAFQLPTQSFSFTGRQRFVLLPELSRVGFDAKSTLHDFTGVTSRVRGEFVVDLAAPDREPTGRVACEASTLLTGVAGRDEGLREHLDVTKHPEIVFTIDGFEPSQVAPAAMTVAGELCGRMAIRGVERAVRMPVQIQVDPARRVEIQGTMPLKLTDYQVPVPSRLGLISMQDEVQVWIALRARSAGGAGR